MNVYQKMNQLFQTLSDVNRLKIIFFIGDKERAVGEIVNYLNISQPLVSHHLRILKQHGILSTKRNGPFIYYNLTNIELLQVINELNEIYDLEKINTN